MRGIFLTQHIDEVVGQGRFYKIPALLNAHFINENNKRRNKECAFEKF